MCDQERAIQSIMAVAVVSVAGGHDSGSVGVDSGDCQGDQRDAGGQRQIHENCGQHRELHCHQEVCH